jgi:hypothetical protein
MSEAFDMDKFMKMLEERGRLKEYIRFMGKIRHGILCMDSALFVSGFLAEKPSLMHVALVRGARLPNISRKLPIKYHFFVGKHFHYGVHQYKLDVFSSLPYFGVEKSIVDLVRLRNRVGVNVVERRFGEYMTWSKRDVEKLLACAKEHRILSVVMEMMYNREKTL